MSRAHLTELLTGAELIKRNAVRQVYRKDGLYIKVDLRGFRRMRSEFLSAKLLGDLGIPAVEPVEWGESGKSGFLVTREFPGSVTALEAFYNSDDRVALATGYAKFIGRIIAAKIYHPDLHTGNVLFAGGEFRLVDLRGVRRFRWFDRMRSDLRRGSLLEFGTEFDDDMLCRLLVLAGSTEPEAELTRLLRHHAERLRGDWPRRTRQILGGYPKFTERGDNNILLAVDRLRRTADLKNAEKSDLPREQAEASFVEHFRLELSGIPHRAARGFDPVSGELWLAPRPDGEPLAVNSRNDWRRRLAIHGRVTAPEQWLLVDGRPCLIDY
ncbi:MAG: hypothetical protein PHI35_02190 [Victivallaceae bacterium]|nr:hypothetical protein [Victivallaceae bacterium]